MLLVNDSTVASSRLVCQPCQVQGLVSVTRRRVGTFLRLRTWNVLRSCRPSLSVSKSRPLVWPSLWQVLQLYHWLNECAASWKTISPLRSSDERLRAAQGNCLHELGGLGVDDLDGVAQIVGDVERLAVGGEGQLGGPAAERDPAVPAVVLEQLGRDQVARAVRRARGAGCGRSEDHHLVRSAATDGQVASGRG